MKYFIIYEIYYVIDNTGVIGVFLYRSWVIYNIGVCTWSMGPNSVGAVAGLVLGFRSRVCTWLGEECVPV